MRVSSIPTLQKIKKYVGRDGKVYFCGLQGMLRDRFASTLEQKPPGLDDMPKLEGVQVPLDINKEDSYCNDKHVDEWTLFERNRILKVDQNKIANKILNEMN